MARLVLSLDGQVLAEYNMNKERYTIGRLPDNDIRIDNPAVSGHHSLIINILNDSFLEDLNSTNGTYVNGKLIKKHALQHGDVITVGHHQLRFVDSRTTTPSRMSSRRRWSSSPLAGRRAPAQGRGRGRPGLPAQLAPTATPSGDQPVALPRGEIAGAERCVRRPRTRAHEGTDNAGSPGGSGGGDHAPRGRLLHRARRQRQGRDFPLVNGAAIGPQARVCATTT